MKKIWNSKLKKILSIAYGIQGNIDKYHDCNCEEFITALKQIRDIRTTSASFNDSGMLTEVKAIARQVIALAEGKVCGCLVTGNEDCKFCKPIKEDV